MEYLQYTNESEGYLIARNRLLEEEIKLRAQIEAVAARRRALPLGGEVPWDYVFERIGDDLMPQKVRMRVSDRRPADGDVARCGPGWRCTPFASPLRGGPSRVVLPKSGLLLCVFQPETQGTAETTASGFDRCRGEHEASRKTIACGTPDVSGAFVVTNSCACFYRA